VIKRGLKQEGKKSFKHDDTRQGEYMATFYPKGNQSCSLEKVFSREVCISKAFV